ncbi:MAG: hypothetical protein MUF84_16885 [Anaerolineae bacterium]|nr:hypothetical protein [Anaerolineae bacterium]
MIWRVLIKVSAVFLSAVAGITFTTIIVSPVIWIMYMSANDGPIFPPPLVALGFFGLPYAVLLLPVQLVVALYEFFTRRSLGLLLLVIAAVDGLLAGLLWSLVYQSTDTMFVIALFAVALLQSIVVYGSYWLWDRFAPGLLKALWNTLQSRKTVLGRLWD